MRFGSTDKKTGKVTRHWTTVFYSYKKTCAASVISPRDSTPVPQLLQTDVLATMSEMFSSCTTPVTFKTLTKDLYS